MLSNKDHRRVIAAEECVLRLLLQRRASDTPDKTFALFSDGTEWTYSELHRAVIETGAALQRLGVHQGDMVLCWLPNGSDALRVWFAINYIGAVYVPINLAYKGQILQHAIKLSTAKILICHGELVDRLRGIDTSTLATVVAIGKSDATMLAGIEVRDGTSLNEPGATIPSLDRDICPWDTQLVLLTSGTTGPSKGVLSSYLHQFATCDAFQVPTSTDRYLVNLPMFHTAGTISVYRMLVRGGSVALVDSFDTRTFWETIRKTKSTCLTLLGGMTSFLVKAPPDPEERNHTLRTAVVIPVSDEAVAFSKRFSVDIYTTFNMTETSWPLMSECNPVVRGTCGRVRQGVEARIVDENDIEVSYGKTGELILRTESPWAMNHGYLGNHEATARAWRNGWFHTGDGFHRDADGNYFFVDRLKDSIRRRGENISSFEVEAEILLFPAVAEVAAVGVPSEFGEDDVLAVISPKANCLIDPGQLIEFLRSRMTHFMIPRYIRVMSELPKTPTQKVQKNLLREAGITADTWDRELAGISIKRDVLPDANKLRSREQDSGQ
jgi:crotonobetaine/carnitine-CoA ligase